MPPIFVLESTSRRSQSCSSWLLPRDGLAYSIDRRCRRHICSIRTGRVAVPERFWKCLSFLLLIQDFAVAITGFGEPAAQ